ncbi:MAG: NAD-glutamate dehydrogenase domain-containing protein [Pseudomonadota bacterium]
MARSAGKSSLMQRRGSDGKARLLQHIINEAKSLQGTDDRLSVAEYVRQYYASVTAEDLRQRRATDLAGAALSHLATARSRRTGKDKFKLFNPTQGKDQWTSPHSVLQVVAGDRPFLVDSLSAAINEAGYTVHLTVHPLVRVQRDSRGTLNRMLATDETSGALQVESFILMEFDRLSDKKRLADLKARIEDVLADVRAATDDWMPMRKRAIAIRDAFAAKPPKGLQKADVDEACAMLDWMIDENFTVLGYREYKLRQRDGKSVLRSVADTGLGILRKPAHASTRSGQPGLERAIRSQLSTNDLLVITKANSRSTVHRPAHLDYIGVKMFDGKGNVIGEQRFLGLFTSIAYSRSAREIPILRRKVHQIMRLSGQSRRSHGGKALMHILETYPRDELFQSSIEDLVRICDGIVGLQERQRSKLFVRRDAFLRFFSCLVFVPRDKYNTKVRRRVEAILLEGLQGSSVESEIMLSDSPLARMHTIVRTSPDTSSDVQVHKVEQQIIRAARTWQDDLRDELVKRLGEEDGLNLFHQYGDRFPSAYEEDVSAYEATFDVERIDQLEFEPDSLRMSLYRPAHFDQERIRFKVFRRHDPIPLSDALPMLEHLGLTVMSERPYQVHLPDESDVWVQDFEMTFAMEGERNPAVVNELVQATFANAWRGRAESDGFNKLAFVAQLDWRQIVLLRAYCRYLLQTGLPFSQAYMQEVMVNNSDVARAFIDEFSVRFDPAVSERKRKRSRGDIADASDLALDRVASADEDRILRAFFAALRSTLRTNYFQRENGECKAYVSFKLDPEGIVDLPKPLPAYEVFVYSPRTEGVHLRGGAVARGGLRWSDRREDFRTEVLGLMKAQKVKNTLIVPTGAKGGFVCKQLPDGDREAIGAEVVRCYRQFISGLLDITDNLLDGAVSPPVDVVRNDGDDPYLVVAADKGTATFSDTANAISEDYGFWMGDAFASGGSVGYDHKGMGITAKGGWEAVKRHFREMGIDVQSEPFTACGIGDMSGDVFGNGMLQSRTTRLVAAFNHLHIFLDPDPDVEASFYERQRLFDLGRSSWGDYDTRLISEGGGIYARQDKSITITEPVRAALGLEARIKSLSPTNLIRAILRAPVDLLWNGGIGTYVKSSDETHDDAGDRTNDALRIDGKELRCKVVGEGGNLGLTQLGRVEYALNDGRINTDFIDNAGGVNCSDREVNIKILLGQAMAGGKLTLGQRNRRLVRMTDEVERLVLRDNYLQTQALSIVQVEAASRLNEHAHLIRQLEKSGELDRAIEFLPSDEEIQERLAGNVGLTRPELAVILSYSKIHLFDQLATSNVATDPHLVRELANYFPAPLRKPFGDMMGEHPLAAEIVATQITNSLINRMGPTFVSRTQEQTGANAEDIARAFTVVREAFDMRGIWKGIERLDNMVPAAAQYSMMAQSTRLLRRSTLWVLVRMQGEFDIARTIDRFENGIESIAGALPSLLVGAERTRLDEAVQLYVEMGVPQRLARRLAGLRNLYSALDIVEVANELERDGLQAAAVYYALGDELQLGWIRDQAERLKVSGRWHALARGSLRDSVDDIQRDVTRAVLRDTKTRDPKRIVSSWMKANAVGVARARRVLEDIQDLGGSDFATLSVAISEARKLSTLGTD